MEVSPETFQNILNKFLPKLFQNSKNGIFHDYLSDISPGALKKCLAAEILLEFLKSSFRNCYRSFFWIMFLYLAYVGNTSSVIDSLKNFFENSYGESSADSFSNSSGDFFRNSEIRNSSRKLAKEYVRKSFDDFFRNSL